MDALYCIAIVVALILPLRWAVISQLERSESLEYFRRYGVIIKRLEALDMKGDVVGRYLDAPIYGGLGFKGMTYEFLGVVPVHYQRRIEANELYLEPGLLYGGSFRGGGFHGGGAHVGGFHGGGERR